MRDYWLTQYLLASVGWIYITICLLAIALALWLPKTRQDKTIAALMVIAVGSILPLQGYQQYRQAKQAEHEYKQRYAKAKALFDERCKSAGEKIYRTVEGVEGVLLMRERPVSMNLGNQYAFDDPYGRDFGGDSYLISFLMGRNTDGTYSQQHTKNTFKFVEVKTESNSITNRFYGKPTPRVSADVFDIKLDKKEVNSLNSEHGVTWKDLSTKEDRDFWIAGSALEIVDLQSNKVIAERIGYMFDNALGNQVGGRSPWVFAEYNACPAFEKSAGGYPVKSSRSRDFIFRVLKPIQGK